VHLLAPYGFSSLHLTAARGTVAVIFTILYILLTDKGLFRIRLTHLLLCLGSGFSMFCTASSYYFAMQATSVSTAVVLMYTAPIYVMICSVLFLGERMTRLKLVAVAMMLVGCGLVSGIVGGLKFDLFGIALGFLSGISYAAYNLVIKIVLRKGCKPQTATCYTFLFMALFAICFSNPAKGVEIAFQGSWWLILLLVAVGLFTSVIPYFLYNIAVKQLPVGTASALGIVEPMAATVFLIWKCIPVALQRLLLVF
jgi:drug/metabolite transporter (DMT)-like permease